MVARGFAMLPGDGRFSLIEVGDLAAALLAVAASAFTGLAEVDDGHGGYSHADLAHAIGRAVGRTPRLLRLPLGVLRAGATVATALARLQRRAAPMLSHDRARYLAHPDWVADPRRALPGEVWLPEVGIEQGLAHAVAWYRANGLLS